MLLEIETSKWYLPVRIFLLFISIDGQLVCCCVIVQSNIPEPKLEWGKEIDTKVDPLRQSGEEINFVANCGSGKHYPGDLQ